MLEDIQEDAVELIDIRVIQARLLNERAVHSCILVSFIITYIAAALWISDSFSRALLWLGPTLLMIAVTYGYARLNAPQDITRDTVKKYLRGHIIVTCITGLVWSGFAIFHSDWSSYASLFIAGTLVCSITIGGMMPSSAYRPAYVALAIFTLLPLAIYWIIFAPTPVRLIGMGLILYFFAGMYASAQAELDTRDGIIARTTKSLNDKLKAQNALIRKASEDKTRFLAATSHDLSQPLHAQGYFIKALRESLSAEAQHKLLDKIETSWRAQGKLLEGLVDVSRLDSHAVKPKPRILSLKSEMEVLTSEFRTLAREKSIRLSTEFEDATVYTDPVLLARIVRNLLSNAIKFTPEKGHVDVLINRNVDTASIIIVDDGIGIPVSDHDAVFDEYVQIGNDNRDRSQGLGLGLSIVRRLTALLDMKIDLTSEPHQGTRFSLTMPLHDQSASAPLLQSKSVAKSAMFMGSPLIILVDDEQDIRDGMSILLTSWGCQIISAATGTEAISLLSNMATNPALLIIDKRLAHGESGIDVIERIREEVNEATPAILITGDISGFETIADRDDIQIMNKPVDPDEIKRVIKAITTPE